MSVIGEGIASALRNGSPSKEEFTSRITSDTFLYKPAPERQGSEFAIESGTLVFYKGPYEEDFRESCVMQQITTLFDDSITPIGMSACLA